MQFNKKKDRKIIIFGVTFPSTKLMGTACTPAKPQELQRIRYSIFIRNPIPHAWPARQSGESTTACVRRERGTWRGVGLAGRAVRKIPRTAHIVRCNSQPLRGIFSPPPLARWRVKASRSSSSQRLPAPCRHQVLETTKKKKTAQNHRPCLSLNKINDYFRIYYGFTAEFVVL